MIPVIVAAALAVVLLSLAHSKHTARQDRQDKSRSNARVLAEFKAISIHRPTHILDVDGTRGQRHD